MAKNKVSVEFVEWKGNRGYVAKSNNLKVVLSINHEGLMIMKTNDGIISYQEFDNTISMVIGIVPRMYINYHELEKIFEVLKREGAFYTSCKDFLKMCGIDIMEE